MSDPFKTTTKQEENILFQVNQRSKARVARSRADEVATDAERDLDKIRDNGQKEWEFATYLLDKLEKSGFRFSHEKTTGSTSSDTVRNWIYDAHHGVWKPFYRDPNKWATLMKIELGFTGFVPVETVNAVMAVAEHRCYLCTTPVNFDQPLNGVAFANGVFDLETGELRPYRHDDYRHFVGKVDFDSSVEGEPELVNELIGYMAGGDKDKENLIRAACYLNIVGIHRLPAFKSAFFIWACENGNGGRSGLFRVINNAGGGAAGVTMSYLAGLCDSNSLLRLRGSNYIYIDECQDITSARSKAVATLKNITGGVTKLEVWEKHRDKYEIEGHWIVNQAFNGMELLYAADPALIARSVPMVTQPLPQDAIDRYQYDEQRQQDLVSVAECSRFLKSLWKEFGHPAKAAQVVNTVKKEFEHDLEQLVSRTEPLTEFVEAWLVDSPGKITPVSKVLSAYNEWLKQMYPTHKQVNVRNITSGLRKHGLTIERVKLEGVLTTCLFGKEVSGAVKMVTF